MRNGSIIFILQVLVTSMLLTIILLQLGSRSSTAVCLYKHDFKCKSHMAIQSSNSSSGSDTRQEGAIELLRSRESLDTYVYTAAGALLAVIIVGSSLTTAQTLRPRVRTPVVRHGYATAAVSHVLAVSSWHHIIMYVSRTREPRVPPRRTNTM